MSQVIHFLSCTFPEYTTAVKRPIWVGDQKVNAFVNFGLQRRFALSICGASSSSSRRNSEYSRPSRGGYSRNKQWQNEERESADDSADEADMLIAKSGPLFSFSGAPKSQAASDSLSKEKEIVELFRKVQAKLREKAAASKEEKGESSKMKDEAKDKTVESLLKLLRKHSSEEANGGNAPVGKVESKKDSRKGPRDSPIARPVSVFRRKSPIPHGKVDREDDDEIGKLGFEEEVETESLIGRKSQGKVDREDGEEIGGLGFEVEAETASVFRRKSQGKVDREDDEEIGKLGFEEEVEAESFVELLGNEDSDSGSDEDDVGLKGGKHEELMSMKMMDLRLLAKSRGVKGFSKMKKSELVDLLADN